MNSTIALLLRHGFAAFSGFLVQHGVAADATNTASLVAGLTTYLIVCALSAAGKAEIGDSQKQVIQKLAGIFASQFLSAVAGWLQASANDVGDPVALSLLLGNATLSKVRGTPQGSAALKQWTGLLVLGSLFFASSCSLTKQDAINYGERVGLFAGDAAIVLAQIQLANAQSELSMELSNPNADKRMIIAKQIGVSTAQQALKAASAAIAKQRAKLDAKQPREGVNPKSSNEEQSTRNQEPSSQDCLEPRGECAIPPCLRVVAIPDYGARVAASLR